MSVPARHGLRPRDVTSSPELSEIHDPTVLADGPAASERSRPRSGSVADRARRYRCGRDAPLRRDRRRASPPPGSTSRTRQSPTPALPDRPDVCDSYNRGRLIQSRRTHCRAPRFRGAPIGVANLVPHTTAGVLDVGDAGRPCAAAIAQIQACAAWARRRVLLFSCPLATGLSQRRPCDSGRPSSRAAQQGRSTGAAEPTLRMQPVESAQIGRRPAYGERRARSWAIGAARNSCWPRVRRRARSANCPRIAVVQGGRA